MIDSSKAVHRSEVFSMIEGGKISARQMILLVFISRIIILITLIPNLLAPPANQDIWLSFVLMVPINLILAVPIYLLAKRFPNQTLYEYCQTILGKVGQGVGILFVLFFLHSTSQSLSNFAGFFTSAIMPETPPLFFVITLTLISAYAVTHGIEILGRFSEFIAPFLMMGIIITFLLLFKDMDYHEITPILEKGIYPTLSGGVYASSVTLETLTLSVILPFLNDQKGNKKIFIFFNLLLLTFALIITFSIITSLGAELAKTYLYPAYITVRIVHVGDFLERIDAIPIGIWILGMYIKVSFTYYLTVLGLSQLFHLKDYKPLVLPIGALIVSLTTLINTNIVDLREFTSYRIYPWYTLFFILFIPSLLLLTAKIRKKGEHSR